MNAYEQLAAIRDQLELNGAHEDSITLVEKFLKRAEFERNSATSVTQIMMVRHLLRQREALDSDAVYNDLQELITGIESRRAVRVEDDAVRPAYEEERAPRPKSYYKALKSQQQQEKK